MTIASPKPSLPVITPKQMATFQANAKRLLAARPNGDVDQQRATKLYGKKEQTNG